MTEAIAAISKGFAPFDADDRLVICNNRFREMYRALELVSAPGINSSQLAAARLVASEDDGVAGVYSDITKARTREAHLRELVASLAKARDEAMRAATA